jgi:hypothetical protein
VYATEAPPCRLDALTPFEHRQIRRRHGLEPSPQTIHVVTVQPCRARQQLCRVGHVRRPLRVHEDPDMWMGSHDRAGGAGVIEMDVREQQFADIGHADAALFEAGRQYRKATGGTGIDQRDAAGIVYHRGRDRAETSLKLQVDP